LERWPVVFTENDLLPSLSLRISCSLPTLIYFYGYSTRVPRERLESYS
jgi:hypothetical protein